jgi:23S rRNA (cytidine(2498)-2'-O)-methyltransferase RlmM-like protein
VTASAESDIKSLQLDDLRSLAQPSYRAGQITDWLYKKRVNSFAEMTDLPQVLRGKLAADFSFERIDVVRVLGSTDTTRKFLFRLSDRGRPDPGFAGPLRIAVGSADNLRFDSGRLRLWLQVLRKRPGRLEAELTPE